MTELKMMRGTEKHPDYVVVGRRGDIVLGFKMLGLIPGRVMGMPERSYLHGRLRSHGDHQRPQQQVELPLSPALPVWVDDAIHSWRGRLWCHMFSEDIDA